MRLPGWRRVTVFETPIAGATREEFLATIRARQGEIRGRREGAQQVLSSRWNMRWSWQTADRSRAFCGFRSVTVFLDYQTHYVRLAGPLAEDPVVTEWWKGQSERQYARHLSHLRSLRDANSETQQRLQSMTSETCEALTREANLVANRDLHAIGERLGMTVSADPPAAAP